MVLLYLPLGHWLQADALYAEYLPASQSEQDVPATAFVDCPALQEMQNELPSEEEYLPIEQLAHESRSEEEILPALHVMHALWLVAPVVAEYLPLGQLLQKLEAEVAYFPFVHVAQSDES